MTSEAAVATQAPLRIKAMSLRGIGSYARGTRIDFRPLTVLCGKNGSGKSTWFKALKILQDSSRLPLFPFVMSYPESQGQGFNRGYLNTEFQEYGRPIDQDNRETEVTFGPAGCIGIEIEAMRNFELSTGDGPNPNVESAGFDTTAMRFLFRGHIEASTQYRVRITHIPGDYDNFDESYVPGRNLREEIELTIDGIPLVRFSKKAIERTYDFACDYGLLQDGRAEGLVSCCFLGVDLAKGTVTVQAHEEKVGEIDVERCCRLAYARIRELVGASLDGVYFLGAIRGVEGSPYFQPEPNADSGSKSLPIQRRHVGESGEWATSLLHQFAGKAVWNVEPPFSGPIDCFYPGSIECPLFDESLRNFFRIIESKQDARLTRIWESCSAEARQMLEAKRHLLDTPRKDPFAQFAENPALVPILPSSFDDYKIVYRFLNEAIKREDLYIEALWPVLPREAAAVLVHGSGKVNEEDLMFFNRCIVADALSRALDISYEVPRTTFESYYNYWMKLLAGVHTKSLYYTGMETNVSFVPLLDEFISEEVSRKAWDSRGVFFHGPFFEETTREAPTSPPVFSSGFHQVHPIVVQLGLMRPGETLCLENPEVHLHPSMQLDVTGLLIRHARAGRQVIVETHSDLVVRRVIRAILEEELPQSMVAIIFTRIAMYALDKSQTSVHYPSSVVEGISVNERGQIANWPEGFMDVEVYESRRLLDIMYPSGDSDKIEE